MIRDDIIGVEMFDEAYRLDSNRLPPVYIKQVSRKTAFAASLHNIKMNKCLRCHRMVGILCIDSEYNIII